LQDTVPEGLPIERAEKIGAIKHFLTKTLEVVAKKSLGTDFDISEDGFTVTPRKKEIAQEGTRHGHEPEFIAYHFLTYIRKACCQAFFEKVLPEIENTKGWEGFILSLGSNPLERYAVFKKRENAPLRLRFLRYIMQEKPYIRLYDKQIVCHVQDVVAGKKVCGVSGAINRYALLPLFGMPKEAPRKVLGKILMCLDLNEEVEIFSSFLGEKGLFETLVSDLNCKAIINEEYSFLDKSPLELIKYLRETKEGGNRQYIFVYKKDTYMWQIGKAAPIPYDFAKLDKERCLHYFNPSATRGTDFKIPLGCYGAYIPGPTTTEPEQGLLRLRALGEGHGVKFFIHVEHAKRIEENLRSLNIRVKDVMQDMETQNTFKKSLENFKAIAFNPLFIIRKHLNQALFTALEDSSLKEDLENFKAVKKFLILSKKVEAALDYHPTKSVGVIAYLTGIYEEHLKALNAVISPSEKLNKILLEASEEVRDSLKDLERLKEEHLKHLQPTMQYASGETGSETQLQEEQEQQQEEQLRVNQVLKKKKTGSRLYQNEYIHFSLDLFIKKKKVKTPEDLVKTWTFIGKTFGLAASSDFALLFKEMPSKGNPMGYLLRYSEDQARSIYETLISSYDYPYIESEVQRRAKGGELIAVYMLQNNTSTNLLVAGNHHQVFPGQSARAKLLQGFTTYSEDEITYLKRWFKKLKEKQLEVIHFLEKRGAPETIIQTLHHWHQNPNP